MSRTRAVTRYAQNRCAQTTPANVLNIPPSLNHDCRYELNGIHSFIPGAIADHYDSYIPAFYMAGSVTLLGSFIYSFLLCWRGKGNTENTRAIVDENVLEKCHTNNACDVGDNELVSVQTRQTCSASNNNGLQNSHLHVDAVGSEDESEKLQKSETCSPQKKLVKEKSYTNDACGIEDKQLASFQERETCPAPNNNVLEKCQNSHTCDVQDTYL